MALINFILDFAALMLWLNWLSIRFDPLVKTSAASLVGTLRKASPVVPKRWIYLVSLLLLILIRAFACWEICAPLHLTPSLNLGILNPTFRSDSLSRMLFFSLSSLLLTLAEFYFWMLLLSVANFKVPDTDPFQKMVRLYLNWLERLPRIFKLLLPFVLGAAGWLALQPALSRMNIVPHNKSLSQLFEQAALIGAAAYLAWKYLIVGILVLHLVNSYVYLGNHPFWNFIHATGRNLLRPLSWLPLRLGKMDFLPLLAIALVLSVTHVFVRLRLPF